MAVMLTLQEIKSVFDDLADEIEDAGKAETQNSVSMALLTVASRIQNIDWDWIEKQATSKTED